jgi:hypothetical protein
VPRATCRVHTTRGPGRPSGASPARLHLSMDAFAALVTDRFHDSNWTDQEVGFAVAREVSVIAVNLGRTSYGFIGKFQALSAGWNDAAERIVKVLLKNELMFAAYVNALRKSLSWDSVNLFGSRSPRHRERQ